LRGFGKGRVDNAAQPQQVALRSPPIFMVSGRRSPRHERLLRQSSTKLAHCVTKMKTILSVSSFGFVGEIFISFSASLATGKIFSTTVIELLPD